MIRVTVSVPPPAGNTTTTLTGFEGYCCAQALPQASTQSATKAPRRREMLIRVLLQLQSATRQVIIGIRSDRVLTRSLPGSNEIGGLVRSEWDASYQVSKS